MSTGTNAIADALQAVVQAIDTDVRFYPEADEKPAGGVSCEVWFTGVQRRSHGTSGAWEMDATIELSTRANAPDWSAALRRIRAMSDPYGSTSILAAIEADITLGGVVTGCLPRAGGATGEELRKKYMDGDRWTRELWLRITWNPGAA